MKTVMKIGPPSDLPDLPVKNETGRSGRPEDIFIRWSVGKI
jgi:hypothetical protein